MVQSSLLRILLKLSICGLKAEVFCLQRRTEGLVQYYLIKTKVSYGNKVL
jgi:hypothetical protein